MDFRKIFICIVCFMFGSISVNAQEIETLYVIKKVPQENLLNIVSNYFLLRGYNILGKNDFYILPSKSAHTSSEYYEILFEQCGVDCYLYYFSNNNVNDFNQSLIKEIKKGHYGVKSVVSPEINNKFRNKAFNLKSNCEKILLKSQSYDFGDDTQLAFDEANNIPRFSSVVNDNLSKQVKTQKLTISANKYMPTNINSQTQQRSIEYKKTFDNQNQSKVLKGMVLTIASGSMIKASLQSAISSASMSQSDRITAVLTEDFLYNGFLIFPKDTILYGSALKANAASGAYSNGSLDLIFNQALLPNGHKINLSIDKISYTQKSERAINITRDVAVGAGIGAIGGLALAVCSGDYSQAMLIGSSLGALGGGLHSVSKKGEDIEIPEGTTLNLKINQPINISPYN